MAAANTAIITKMGQAVTYTPDGGDDQAIDGVFTDAAGQYNNGERGETEIKTATLLINSSDVATVGVDDVATVGGVRYRVEHYSDAAGMWLLELVAETVNSKHHSQLRDRQGS